jgi:DNA-binding transcriptional MerR regulator
MIEGVQDEEPVGIGTAAQRLGVTTSTLRSWERRYNLTRPQRTTGAHRRYTAADLTRLTSMRQLIARGMPAAQAAALISPSTAPGPTPGEIAARLREATSALDAGHVSALLHGALLRHGTTVTWEQILSPVLIELGDRWHDRGYGVDSEHVLSGTAEAVLRWHAYQARADPAPGEPVLLLTTPGERHTLPLAALAAALTERATPSVLLAELPPGDLAHALTRIAPRAALLWAHAAGTADVATLDVLREASPLVYTAGPGWAGRPASAPHLATFAAAVDALAAR